MRYFLKVAYNGLSFHGSQIQGDLSTIQFHINKALSILLRSATLSFGASRTDEGVHALGNFYHFDVTTPIVDNFKYKMNAILPPGIAVKDIYLANNENANARFDAIKRSYRYQIYHTKDPFLYEKAMFCPYDLDFDRLKETSKILLEYRDFESFSKKNTQAYTFLCDIYHSEWVKSQQEIHYTVSANRFLRGMVRALVGTQLKVASGKISINEFRDIIESKDCRKADFSVPGHGLYLEEIAYPDNYFTKIQ